MRKEENSNKEADLKASRVKYKVLYIFVCTLFLWVKPFRISVFTFF